MENENVKITKVFRNSYITIESTPKKFFIKYKNKKLDISFDEIEVGLMKALLWFGNLCCQKETNLRGANNEN